MIRLAALVLLAGCGGVRHYPDGSNLEGQLEREVIALHQTVRHLKDEAGHCLDAEGTDTLYADLTQVFSGSEIEVSKEGGATLIVISVSHLFADPYSLRFRDEASMNLDLLSTALNLHPQYEIVVEGHTDDKILPANLVRRFGSHLDLSFQYAAAVMQRLSEDYRVAEDRFTVAGRGQWAPIASNDVTSGQLRNQRVEIRVYPGSTP